MRGRVVKRAIREFPSDGERRKQEETELIRATRFTSGFAVNQYAWILGILVCIDGVDSV